MQAFIHFQPACLEEMWRCGALPALVVSVAKGAALASVWEEGMQSMSTLMNTVLKAPPPGQQPWYAASTERQQFALLVLARIGGVVAAQLLQHADGAPPGGTAEQQALLQLSQMLCAAAEQLGEDPLLRQHLEAAAPGLARADAAGAHSDPAASDQGALDELRFQRKTIEPLQLLVSLGQQLDPLALGVRLSGCYNPACACLVGDSEAAMALKTCAGCRIAR